ncbi:MAG TPA: response regulator transcription factor [Mycobacteriales bacterium]|jgi:DNA-binding NarL/FixJ family response regulator|nr:response regulator transcription factor [Mycobacteriales bacterium]
MGEALELVLADDHVVFLDALTAIMTQLGHAVVAAVTTRGSLADSVRAFQPDVCVLENRLRDGSGVDLIGKMTVASPNTRFVVLTADLDPVTLRQALDAGAAGYVHKTRGIAALLDVLTRVSAGEIVIEGSFSRPQIPEDQAPPQLLRLATYLTQRELECLALLAAGMDTLTMARRLGVSTTTVRSHVQAVLTKLGVHSRLEAASLAIRYHLVDATTVPAGRRSANAPAEIDLRHLDENAPRFSRKTYATP